MKSNKNICLNCECQLNDTIKYCPQCGQEAVYRNLSLRFLIKSFFEAFLNFDVKILHSLRDIWRPNVITKTFLSGKREYHVHPFRFYLITLIVFFGLLSINMKDFSLGVHMNERVAKFELYKNFDTLSHHFDQYCEEGIFDSLKHRLTGVKTNYDQDTFVSLDILGTDYDTFGISTYDAFHLSYDELYKKYKVNSWLQKHVIHQYIKVSRNPENVIKYGIANMLWGIILLTIFIALCLKLLYIRHDAYFIEHLLLVSHFHILFLLVMSILLIINLIHPLELAGIQAIIFSITSLHFFYSLKSYFGQGLIKTFFKYLTLPIFYSIGMTLISLIIGFFTFVVF